MTEYIPDELANVEIFLGRKKLHKHCAGLANEIDGDYAEFGVYKGVSARWILNLMSDDRKLWLFDSFEGLPEDWEVGLTPWAIGASELHVKGRFALVEVPVFKDSRAKIVPGWFEDTLPAWAWEVSPKLAYIHIDCDLYSSAETVLRYTTGLMQPGAIVLFDELWGYENYLDGEWRALQEWTAEAEIEYDWVGRTNKCQAALRIR